MNATAYKSARRVSRDTIPAGLDSVRVWTPCGYVRAYEGEWIAQDRNGGEWVLAEKPAICGA